MYSLVFRPSPILLTLAYLFIAKPDPSSEQYSLSHLQGITGFEAREVRDNGDTILENFGERVSCGLDFL